MTKEKLGYAEKIRIRRRLAHRFGLPDMPWPALKAALESKGIDTSKMELKNLTVQ